MTLVSRFDDDVDALLERVRGNAAIDALMQGASRAAEFSGIWHVAGIARGAITGRWDQTLALSIGLGAESAIVNQGIKRIFRRRRPTEGGDERFDIRTPTTSSFPSGHASAAAFAATILIGWDGPKSAPLWGTMAATVALSRPYVRIHHASDIVGGLAVGYGLARVARRFMPA